MKRNIIIIALLISIFCAYTVSLADETNSFQSNLILLRLQQKLLSMQAQEANAAAAEDYSLQAIDIRGTYKGTAPGMSPTGTCISLPVQVKIDLQCGNFAKGSITAFGVTVPVTGIFKNNSISLDGVNSGSPIWLAGLGAQYAGGNFVAGSFSFLKNNTTVNNNYDSGWLLKKQ